MTWPLGITIGGRHITNLRYADDTERMMKTESK